MPPSPLPSRLTLLPLLSLCLLLLSIPISEAQFPAGEYVTELDNEVFAAEVKGRPFDGFYLVEFYSPTCGHCRAFGPTYEEVGNSLRAIVPVGRLSVHTYRDLTAAYNVKSVPHIALFLPQNEHPIVYHDDRTVKDIVEWVLNARDEFEMPVKEVTPDGVEAFLNIEKKIYPSRYLMINSGPVPTTWNLIHRRVAKKAILGHLDANLVKDLDALRAKYNISRLPAVVAHLRPQEWRKPEENIQVITYQGKALMSDVQAALSDEGAFHHRSHDDDVDTDGIPYFTISNTDSGFEPAFFAYGALAFLICACFGLSWAYKNRNRKVKEVAVDLQSVILDVSGKKARD